MVDYIKLFYEITNSDPVTFLFNVTVGFRDLGRDRFVKPVSDSSNRLREPENPKPV